MEIIHQSNLDSQRSTELAKLEARVAELRAALGKGCISCAGCPYADICNKKLPTESNEDALTEVEPGSLEDSDDIPNLSTKDDKNETTSYDTASVNADNITPGGSIETLPPTKGDNSKLHDSEVDKLIIASLPKTNIIDSYAVQIEPSAPVIDSRRFRESSQSEDNVVLSILEKKAVIETEYIPKNDKVKSLPIIESFVDLPIHKHPTMGSPMPIKLHRDVFKPSIEEIVLNISLPAEQIINQQSELPECSDILSPIVMNNNLLVETIPYIEGLDLIYEPANPAYVDYLAGLLTKNNIDEESLFQLKLDSNIIGNIFVNPPRDDSITGDVEITTQNILEPEEISVITATDSVIKNYNNDVDIDYALTHVYQNTDSYCRYISSIASTIARLALSLTFKKIPFA